MSEKTAITLTINGRDHAIGVEPRRTLADAIREDCGQTGTHIGCEHGICGACTVIVDGEPVRSCLMFAVQADRQKNPDRRRAGGWRQVAPDATGLHGPPRASVRILHARLPDVGRRRAGTRARHQRRRPDRRALIESLPLHRLPEHHQGRPRGGQRNAKATSEAASRLRTLTAPTLSLKGRGSRLLRAMTAKQKFVGRSVPRLEDRPLLTGQGRFAADISFPNQWHMRVVRSPVAHGNIKSVDARAALALPGVRAAWTHADVAHIAPIPFRLTGLKTLEPYRQPVLAKDVVRYVGEPVAVIFADDAYVAEDAAELIELSIDPLPATMRATAAARRLCGRSVDRTGASAKGLWRCRRRIPQRTRRCCA